MGELRTIYQVKFQEASVRLGLEVRRGNRGVFGI